MGVHSCLFYETKKDLCEILIPFFEEGFRKHEFCIWIIAEPLSIADIRQYLRNKAELWEQYIAQEQLQVLNALEWYTDIGRLCMDKLSRKWVSIIEQAQARGFSGIRVCGDASWLDMRYWDEWLEYERSADELIKKRDITALCTYPLLKFKEAETFLLSTCHNVAAKNQHGCLEYTLYNSK